MLLISDLSQLDEDDNLPKIIFEDRNYSTEVVDYAQAGQRVANFLVRHEYYATFDTTLDPSFANNIISSANQMEISSPSIENIRSGLSATEPYNFPSGMYL